MTMKKGRGLGWPIAVTVILAATVAVNIWVAVIAGDDPSFAVEPNYYQKAVQWDSTMARQRESARLGWRLQPTLGAVTNGRARLDVTLVDSSGAPIGDATVKVEAFFNARANTVIDATLSRSVGVYTTELPVRHTGEWELRFDVTRGRDRFVSTARLDAHPVVAAGRTT